MLYSSKDFKSSRIGPLYEKFLILNEVKTSLMLIFYDQW